MILYQSDLSIYSTKVRLALAVKGCAVEMRAPPEGYRSAAYRALVPAATIPALVDGDLVLSESDAIIEYLEETQPGAALLPSDAAGRGRARMLSRLIDLRVEAGMRAQFGRVAAVGPEDLAGVDAGVALVVGLLDPVGPFALGAMPSLPDFGAAVALLWRDGFGGAPSSPRLAAWRAAMDAHPAFAGVMDPYRPMVAAWFASKLG